MTLKPPTPSGTDASAADPPTPALRTTAWRMLLLGGSLVFCLLTGLLWVGRTFSMSGGTDSLLHLGLLLGFLLWMLLVPALLGLFAWKMLKQRELHTRSLRGASWRVGAIFGGSLLMALLVWPVLLNPELWRDAQSGLLFIFLPLYGALAAALGVLLGSGAGILLARVRARPEGGPEPKPGGPPPGPAAR